MSTAKIHRTDTEVTNAIKLSLGEKHALDRVLTLTATMYPV